MTGRSFRSIYRWTAASAAMVCLPLFFLNCSTYESTSSVAANATASPVSLAALTLDVLSQSSATSSVRFSGICNSGLTIRVQLANVLEGSTPCSDGKWVYVTSPQFTAGTRTYQFAQTDSAGHSTQASGTWTELPFPDLFWLSTPGGMPPAANGDFSTSGLALPPPGPRVAAGSQATEDMARLVSVTHTNDSKSWALSVGTGGQIYSLRDANGSELIGDQQLYGEYMDRVIQPIFVSLALNKVGSPTTNFIQIGGSYAKTPANPTSVPYYSPALATQIDTNNKTVNVLSWPQQATKGNWINPYLHQFESPMILQTSIRDVGGGRIEITEFVTNFSQQYPVTFDHHNLPWVGLNSTLLKSFALSAVDALGYSFQTIGNWSATTLNTTSYGGWAAWAVAPNGTAPAMAIVYGNPAGTAPVGGGQIRAGYDESPGYLLPDGTYSLFIFTHIKGGAGNSVLIGPGQTWYHRYYLLIDKDGIDDLKSQAQSLATNNVSAGFLNYSISIPTQNSTCQKLMSTPIACNWLSFNQPINSSPLTPLPIFALKDLGTGQTYITTSPYALGIPAVATVKYANFLGWGISVASSATAPAAQTKKLSELVGSAWLDPSGQGDVWVVTQ